MTPETAPKIFQNYAELERKSQTNQEWSPTWFERQILKTDNNEEKKQEKQGKRKKIEEERKQMTIITNNKPRKFFNFYRRQEIHRIGEIRSGIARKQCRTTGNNWDNERESTSRSNEDHLISNSIR
jgi:hypothetical protein